MKEVKGENMVAVKGLKGTTVGTLDVLVGVSLANGTVMDESLADMADFGPPDHGFKLLEGVLHAAVTRSLTVCHYQESCANVAFRDEDFAFNEPKGGFVIKYGIMRGCQAQKVSVSGTVSTSDFVDVLDGWLGPVWGKCALKHMIKSHQHGVGEIAYLAIDRRAWEMFEQRRNRLGSVFLVLLMVRRERWNSR